MSKHNVRTARESLTVLFARIAVLLLSLQSGSALAEDAVQPPPVAREFRAAWVATVANIDWPSKPGLPVEQQQRELIAILDRAVKLNLNAIVFQVRPHADALYASQLEPWSEYLTGTMGQAPEPFYDPLELAVTEAHRRGLELHAWFNPYRATHPSGKSAPSPDHISNISPEVVRQYGKHQWIDPGESRASAHSLAVILDVVQRYDVDGIHFDDYFYPYPIKDDDNQKVPFPDDRSWEQAQAAGVTLSRDDWRRENVNRFIQSVYNQIKQHKPWVKFGVSPFGIWRPGNPESIKGFDAYASLYADARRWQQEGWLDYLTPQLYWEIESAGQSYPVLLQWWHQQNILGRHLWPGNFTSRVKNAEKREWTAKEIVRQVKLTQQHSGATGNVHFSMKALQDDSRGVAEALLSGPYAHPALVPATPWIPSKPPGKPQVRVQQTAERLLLHLRASGSKEPWLWVVRTCSDETWSTEILPGHQGRIVLPVSADGTRPERAAISAVNRLGSEGPITLVEFSGRTSE